MHAVNVSMEAEWDAAMNIAHNVDREMPDYDNGANNVPASTLPRTEGGELTITYGDEHMKDVYVDEYTGEPLTFEAG